MLFSGDIMNKSFMSQERPDFHCFCVHKPKEGGTPTTTTAYLPKLANARNLHFFVYVAFVWL